MLNQSCSRQPLTQSHALPHGPKMLTQLHVQPLLKWNLGFSNVIQVQPSSAAVERVFSVLKKHFTQYQNSSLQDYVETSLMLEFNKSQKLCQHNVPSPISNNNVIVAGTVK